ncbi:amidohydrolase [Croceicoccus ponticola]|uniref:Amidohydrolase n=1 Tax=Croceicoccus ponticola TaxID=2217664 RepID=A0A437GY17_9SPHN|nr:amidohydrolase [Croceicoccus ponticola]RVQ66356.1 amidohydrolase [Croceicoccus ponticola]
MNIVDRRRFLAGGTALAAQMVLWRKAALPRSGPMIETAFTNGHVWTGDGAAVFSDALGITGGRIVALGRDAVTALSGPRTQVIDLAGAFVTPGIIDPHVHFTTGALQLSQPVLRDAKNRGQFAEVVARAASALPPGQWITGGNWDNDGWGGELPHRNWIDAVTADTPVAVTRYDLHMVLLNSRALAAIGVDESIAEIAGGVIGRDASGSLTGIFKDAAKDFVLSLIPAESDTMVDAANRTAMQIALSKGITQLCEPGMDWLSFHSMRRIDASGEMPMRFNAMVPLADWSKLARIVADEGKGGDKVRWSGCKAIFDGSLGSRTALFYEPYLDDPTTSGIIVTDPDDLRAWMTDADAAGLQLCIHAIGDKANDTVLDVMDEVAAKNGPRDRRFRIEHAQHLKAEAMPRFASSDVIASVQPYHAIDDGRWAVRRIGPQRLETTYAFHSLMENGATLCFGSDWPVAPLDPLTGLDAAITRATLDGEHPQGWYPRQRVTAGQALLAYTRNGARATMRDDTGTLAPGKHADFVVWDRDLTGVSGKELLSANALQTWVGGTKRHG